MSQIKTYLRSILLPIIVGGVVGIVTSQWIDYNSLQKPLLAPPGILFPIIWTILYILMGVSGGRLKSKKQEIDKIYYIQLAINALWPIFFFVLKWRFFSFLWIILLNITIAMMITKFKEKDAIAGKLQIPYLLWTLFATYLNLSIYILN